MNISIIEKIIEEIEEKIKVDKEQKIRIPKSTGIPLDKKNFHEIKDIKSDKKIAFIDGGNAEIIAAPSFSAHFIRVYYTIYKNNKRLKNKKFEFYTFSDSYDENDKIRYKTEIFPINFKIDNDDLIFDSEDRTLTTAFHAFPISKIGEIARRFAELKIATELTNELNKGDIIVLDGNLQGYITNESEYLKNLYNNGIEKNILITALSKTMRLFTNTGNSINAVLEEASPNHEWYYHPIIRLSDENYQADISFVKLNINSKYIFKLEIYNKQKFNDELFSILKQNSKDPVFLGYPYGLIEADRFAKVSNKEREYLQTLFIAKSKKLWNRISKHLTAIDAHDILNRIN